MSINSRRGTSQPARRSNVPPRQPTLPEHGEAGSTIPIPKYVVLVGQNRFLERSREFFSAHVRETNLWGIPDDRGDSSALTLPFQPQDSWCLACDMTTSARAVGFARRLLQNTSNIPFVVLIRDPADLTDALLTELLELGVTHALVMPGTWIEAWAEMREALLRRLNPMISVRSTKTWLVGVLQSVAAQERNCCVRISAAYRRRATDPPEEESSSTPVSPVGLLGEVYFHEGQPVYAWSMRSRGDEAIIDLLHCSTIQITITHIGWIPFPPNVRSTLQGLLLEYMKREDDSHLIEINESTTEAKALTEAKVFHDRDDPVSAPLLIDLADAAPLRSPSVIRPPRWPWTLAGAAMLIAVIVWFFGKDRSERPVPARTASAAPAVPLAVRSSETASPPKPLASSRPAEAPKTPDPSPPVPAVPSSPPKGTEEKVPPPPKAPAPPQELILECSNRIRIEAVLIPAGRFTMGASEQEPGWERDEGPAREVTIASPFYMGRYEVTQEQYEEIMGQNPSQFRGPRRPVESVSSFEAIEFCDRLSKKSRRTVRLPSEVEWEYACRAGTTTPFHCGTTIASDRANFDGRTGYGGQPSGFYRRSTQDVGSFPPNAFGLYDMHGNVGEWCLDFYDPHAYEKSAGAAIPASPNNVERVWRGGAYNDPPRRIRSAFREHFNPGGRDSFRGFRVVITTETELPPGKHP